MRQIDTPESPGSESEPLNFQRTGFERQIAIIKSRKRFADFVFQVIICRSKFSE